MFLNCLPSQNERFLEIVFSGHQNAKINITKHSTKMTEMVIPLKFGLGPFVLLHVCSNHHSQMSLWIFHKLHHDNKLPNTKTVSYFVCLDKMNDVKKGRSHVTKMLKMNLMKQTMNKEGQNCQLN